MIATSMKKGLIFAIAALAMLVTGLLACNPAQAGSSVSAHTKYHDGMSAGGFTVGSRQMIQPTVRRARVIRRNHH